MNGKRRFGLLVAIALNVVLPVLVFAQTAVPNVIGMAQVDAEAAITAAGFVPVSSLEYSTQTAGLVFFQSPAGGTVASPGATVNLKVSQGAVTPEAYNYQGLIYSFLGIVGGLSWVIGIRVGVA